MITRRRMLVATGNLVTLTGPEQLRPSGQKASVDATRQSREWGQGCAGSSL